MLILLDFHCAKRIIQNGMGQDKKELCRNGWELEVLCKLRISILYMCVCMYMFMYLCMYIYVSGCVYISAYKCLYFLALPAESTK